MLFILFQISNGISTGTKYGEMHLRDTCVQIGSILDHSYVTPIFLSYWLLIEYKFEKVVLTHRSIEDLFCHKIEVKPTLHTQAIALQKCLHSRV